MPDWIALANQVRSLGSHYDVLRRDYLRRLHKKTGRNTIIYYSGWLQKRNPDLSPFLEINDQDKNAFMATIHQLDRKKGLDLILHTPGGEIAATESLVDYLRQMFNDDLRAIVPQIAMSAGTMISCACKKIIMGKQSSLGPIDPQYMGLPAHGVIEEFTTAEEQIRNDDSKIPLWQPIIAKYPPTFIGECRKAIDWSEEMTNTWLKTGMFKNDSDADEKAKKIVDELGNHSLTKSHARHISAIKCKEIGLAIEMMEDDQALQELILSVHHLAMLTLNETDAVKIIENHVGKAIIQSV